jgi:hypothetical protein
MTDLNKALQTAVASIPECVAAGYIDLWSGTLIDINSTDSQPKEVLGLLAAATSDLFQGPNVTMIESIFKRARGNPDDGTYFFEEIVVNSANLIHIFLRSQCEDRVACFVCRRSVNMGMALTKSRNAMSAIEASV